MFKIREMKSGAIMNFKKGVVAMVAIALIAFPGCSDDDSADGNRYVNNWIYANMEYFYLWNTELPGNPNRSKEPDDFFNSLLSEDDRFSWIQEDYIELLNSLQGVNKEAGYDFKLYKRPDNDDVIAQIMYIKEGSLVETEEKDLMRGDIITHINGMKMTTTNYQELLSNISENHTVTYTRPTDGVEVDMGTLSLNTAEFAENPNFMSKIIETSGHKIGYYVYNFFAVGPDEDSEIYNDQMDAIFAEFKSAGITDLVVDLRYNSGGAEGATINLASLIGENIDDTKIFTRRQYNDQLNAELLADPRYGPDFLNRKFITKTSNVGSLLNNDRVYILTSSRTASASELLINGLAPHMNSVFLIGDKTVGKNVGSISIYEEDDPKNTWGMQPIVAKSFNSQNQSEYSEGFSPNILELDNDLDLMPIGDETETLLSLAIDHITGGSARKNTRARKQHEESIGTSADFKRGSYNLVLDSEPLKNLFKSSQIPMVE